MEKPKCCRECKYCEIDENSELICTLDEDFIISGDKEFIHFLCPKEYNQ